eukprot:scaffold108084_cov29-Tisochrysis_lutea.AAC.2
MGRIWRGAGKRAGTWGKKMLSIPFATLWGVDNTGARTSCSRSVKRIDEGTVLGVSELMAGRKFGIDGAEAKKAGRRERAVICLASATEGGASATPAERGDGSVACSGSSRAGCICTVAMSGVPAEAASCACAFASGNSSMSGLMCSGATHQPPPALGTTARCGSTSHLRRPPHVHDESLLSIESVKMQAHG